MGRGGVRPRGFVLRSFVDNENARRELAARWGYPVAPGEIHLAQRHDRVQARVTAEGGTVLEFELLDRDPISGADIQYIASMHLARNRQDEKAVLVQCDPEYVFAKAERGRPKLIALRSGGVANRRLSQIHQSDLGDFHHLRRDPAEAALCSRSKSPRDARHDQDRRVAGN